MFFRFVSDTAGFPGDQCVELTSIFAIPHCKLPFLCYFLPKPDVQLPRKVNRKEKKKEKKKPKNFAVAAV